MEHDTGVEALDVGLKIHVDDSELQQTIYSMVARLMGDLAQTEHTQKLQRIRSGVRAAQSTGKWTGRPPGGFVVEEGYLHVDPADFLHAREAVARVDRGGAFAESPTTPASPNPYSGACIKISAIFIGSTIAPKHNYLCIQFVYT